MNRFEYHGEADFIPSVRFRLQCAMEKTPGIIIQDEKEYHIDNHGRWVNPAPFHTETKQLLMNLVLHQKIKD